MRTKHGGCGSVSFLAGCRAAMETEAGGPGSGSEKRKRPATTTKQGARGPGSVSKRRKRTTAGTPAVAEVRATGDKGPPPGTGEDAADRISLIPDAILGEIVSLLPTKEGARTQVLASRWRHIWRSSPLNLDYGCLVAPINLDCGGKQPKKSDHDHVVSSILTSHRGPVRRLSIPVDHSCSEATVEAWLLSPTLDNLQELEYCYVRDYGRGHGRVWRLFGPPVLVLPPPSTFRFASTLRLANIGKCHLPYNTVQGLHFPQLKHLALYWVCISECSIHRLIDGCPALECLLVYCISGLFSFRINALRLKCIGVHTYFHRSGIGDPQLEKLIIENAPCLERLFRLHLFDDMQLSIISAPKLEILVSINDDYPIFSKINERLRADSLTNAAHLVKSLAVHMPIFDLDLVIDLMRCFPCLEKLYIQDEYVLGSSLKNSWRHKHRKLIGCLDIHLKTIVLETYQGTVSDVNFVTFFVLNARELELMTIQVKTIDEEFIAKQRSLLQLENKASSSAQFQFTTVRCLRDICHVRDLDLSDPFVGRC